MKWFERMRRLRDEKGWSVAEYARRAHVSSENIHKYEKGVVDRPRGNVLDNLAAPFGMTRLELEYGVEQNTKLRIASDEKLPSYERSGADNGIKRIPRITLSELSRHQAGQMLGNLWSGIMSIVVDDTVGSNCIAVTVEDNSMLPEFKQGDVLICDPDAPIEPGNFVIAKVGGREKAVFRKYRPLSAGGERFELRALNEDYPSDVIDESHPGHIIARARKVMKDI